jgi:hypothetical protein
MSPAPTMNGMNEPAPVAYRPKATVSTPCSRKCFLPASSLRFRRSPNGRRLTSPTPWRFPSQ